LNFTKSNAHFRFAGDFPERNRIGWHLLAHVRHGATKRLYLCSNDEHGWGGKMDWNMDWKKALIYGSLAAGVIVFLTGRRPVGLAIAGIGLATLASENPEKFEELWRRAPEYLEKGSKFVDVAASFMERMGEHQGGFRNMPVAGGTRY
jgi:hypothetical protein